MIFLLWELFAALFGFFPAPGTSDLWRIFPFVIYPCLKFSCVFNILPCLSNKYLLTNLSAHQRQPFQRWSNGFPLCRSLWEMAPATTDTGLSRFLRLEFSEVKLFALLVWLHVNATPLLGSWFHFSGLFLLLNVPLSYLSGPKGSKDRFRPFFG